MTEYILNTLDVITLQVYIAWRITGHGSDEHGCGEFCVTSHHFVVNNKWNNVSFDNPSKLSSVTSLDPLRTL